MRVSFADFGGTAVSCSEAEFPVRERDSKREKSVASFWPPAGEAKAPTGEPTGALCRVAPKQAVNLRDYYLSLPVFRFAVLKAQHLAEIKHTGLDR